MGIVVDGCEMKSLNFAVRRQELEYRRCTGILVVLVRYVSKILTAVPVEAAVLGCSNNYELLHPYYGPRRYL